MDASARLGGVAAAIGNALFPRLAYLDSEDARILIRQAIGALYAILTPPVAAAVILMDPALRLWLGDALGGQAAPIARILLIACWLNAFAQMPFARLQASGRPDVVGKLHSIEVPLYLAFLFGAIVKFGLLGAAFAFLGRTVIDAAALFLANSRRIDHGVALSGTLTALLALAAFLGLEPTRLDVDRAILGAIAAAAASGFAALVVMPRPLRQGCASALRVLWRRTLSQ
jgi:O-antigen/teichoic acid export membrane protein